MKAEKKNGTGFEGYQKEDRTLPALPMRITYQACRYEHFMRAHGDDWLFSFSKGIKGLWNSGKTRESTHLDPYAIRTAFEAVDTPEKALSFLSEAGSFWLWEDVHWSQFQEWQRFFQWVRLGPEAMRKDIQGNKALVSLDLGGDSFFAIKDKDFSRARFPPHMLKQLGQDEIREIEIKDRVELMLLRTFARSPGFLGIRAVLDISWYELTICAVPEDLREFRAALKGRRPFLPNKTLIAPYLRIEARNVLEAIAATIYADRAHGVKTGKCLHCGKLFKIESDHRKPGGRMFCPAPLHLKSQPCKNAYLQKERREKERTARDSRKRREEKRA